MTKKYDAIIIGAGVIGAPIAYELSKMGYKTMSVDKLPDAGEGSTAGSCAIVRAHYSTEDGVAFAYEGFKYWLDWENYLDHVKDEKGLAKFMNTGSLLIKSQGHKWQNVKKHYDAVGVQYKEMTNEEILKMIPVVDLHEFWPVKRPEDPAFWEDPTKMLEGGLFCPEGGYVNDPALSAHNIMRAAEAKGATFMFNAEVVKIRAAEGKVQGITLADGNEIDAPVVVNCAGPHSFKINQMAPGVWEGCNIKTKALRHEVMYCPAPEDYDYLNKGYHQSDGDIGCYVRPKWATCTSSAPRTRNAIPRSGWTRTSFTPARAAPAATTSSPKRSGRPSAIDLGRRVPTLQVPNQPKGVVDLYDCSDDWIPVYDKSDLGGFYMAVGTSGNQYKNAPVVGRMMAELIDACEKGLDHDKKPFQYKMKYTGRTLDVGFFSRKREINYNSSFSVNG